MQAPLIIQLVDTARPLAAVQQVTLASPGIYHKPTCGYTAVNKPIALQLACATCHVFREQHAQQTINANVVGV
jgi:hypothetical protein